jgi:methylmalonyl-CoA epimerase
MSPLEEPPAGSVGDIMRKFIDSKGEGMHHLAICVDDIEAAMEQLKKAGVALIDKTPRPGAHGKVAFAHPKSTFGILIELCEPYNHK